MKTEVRLKLTKGYIRRTSNVVKFILGLKLGMSQIFDEKGNVIPVTLIEVGPCIVTQIKTKEKLRTSSSSVRDKDGYEAVQVGFQKLREKKVKKPQKRKPFKYLREFRGDIDILKYKTGDVIDASVFKEEDRIKVTGLSKGKGFAGAVKRWHFKGRPATRGTKHELRTPGSVGASRPSRVIKGKKMPGRMGFERVTIKNLKVVKVDPEKNLLAVKGVVPGAKGTLLEIRC